VSELRTSYTRHRPRAATLQLPADQGTFQALLLHHRLSRATLQALCAMANIRPFQESGLLAMKQVIKKW
jgi:hypothetical protein